MAFDLLERAAYAGDAEAMADLGDIYAQDPEETRLARYWLKKSAEAGNDNGMMWFAKFLEKRGDIRGAKYWYYQAAAAGIEDGLERLQEIQWESNAPWQIVYGGCVETKRFRHG